MSINKFLYFDDLFSFWNYSMQESTARNKSSRKNTDLEWSGGLTWDEAKKMAKSGWAGGMKEIEKYQAKISPIVAQKVLRPKQIYAQSGYIVDIGTFLANEPECFITREFEVKNYPGKVYKLVCSISFSAAIEPETIIQRGAMICALIDAIEYAGHRAEVICNSALAKNSNDLTGKNKENGWLEISVVVKKANQPLEMTDLAFCLAHPSMLRRMMFSVAEIEGWSDFVDRYGYPAEATDKGDIYIKEVFSGLVPNDKAIKWVLEELEKLDIDIEID